MLPANPYSQTRKAIQLTAFLLPIAIMCLAIIVRSGTVEVFFGTAFYDCGGCLRLLAVKHDLPILMIFLLAHISGATCKSRPLSIALRIFACVVLFIYFVDLVVFGLFTHRLNLLDVASYGGESRAIALLFSGYIQRAQSWPVAVVLVGMIASVALAFARVRAIPAAVAFSTMMGVLLLGSLYFTPESAAFVHAWTYRNIVESQKTNTAAVPYSEQFVRQFIADTGKNPSADPANSQCIPGRGERRNVIVVVMESLSSHQSKYYSGVNNWTPNIDILAKEGFSVTDFYANGFSTSQGLVAVLTGHDPLPSAHWGNSANWRGAADSLPFRLKSIGYKTAMLSNVDLDFLDARKFFQSIGFDEIEGYDDPAFLNVERFQWGAPADDSLYLRVTRWVAGQTAAKPYFILVNTLSTHPPFINPRTNEKSEEAAFRYGDQAFGGFVTQLRKEHFFDNGILVLTGDHRTMTPVNAAEASRFGAAAPTRIPLLAIGAGIPAGSASGSFQQADIPSSIEYLVAPTACFANRQRNIFAVQLQTNADERCIMHSRGDEMDLVDIFCGSRQGRVKLNGDATGAVSGHVPQAVLDDINRERIGWFERKSADGAVVRSLPTATK